MNFSDLFKNLLKNPKSDDNSSETLPMKYFNEAAVDELNNQTSEFWKKLLIQLRTDKIDEKNVKIPVYNSDFGFGTKISSDEQRVQEEYTPLAFIQNRIDLSASIFNSLMNLMKRGTTDTSGQLKPLNYIDLEETGGVAKGNNYFWNESVSKLIAYFCRFLDPEAISALEKITYEGNSKAIVDEGGIPLSNTTQKYFRIKDIKDANAGNSFSAAASSRWVQPWYNVDTDTYSKVRSSDKILNVLGSSSDLQFTRSQDKEDEHWIRLIMPKYLRNVEIEDLNRNFWVIGQVLTGICAYLFDENNPINKMFKGLLDEIVQLWENILYLWLEVALLSQKPYYTNIHSEVVPIPVDKIRNYMKFDDFENYTSKGNSNLLKSLWENELSYLKDQYSECNLCIAPMIREDNYKHNYYSAEYYPGVILFNRNLYNEGKDGAVSYIKIGKRITIDNDIGPRIGAINNKEDNLKYCAPFSDVSNKSAPEEETFYGIIRVVPTLDVKFDSTVTEEKERIKFNSLTLTVYDVAWNVVNSTSRSPVIIYNCKDSNITIPYYSSVGNENITEVQPLTGYYLGELISKKALTKRQPIKIKFKKRDIWSEDNLKADITITLQDKDDNSKTKQLQFKKGTNDEQEVQLEGSNYSIWESPSSSYVNMELPDITISNGKINHERQDYTDEQGGYIYDNSNNTITITNYRDLILNIDADSLTLEPVLYNADGTSTSEGGSSNLSKRHSTIKEISDNFGDQDIKILTAFVEQNKNDLAAKSDSQFILRTGYHDASARESDTGSEVTYYKLDNNGKAITDTTGKQSHASGFDSGAVLLNAKGKENSIFSYKNYGTLGHNPYPLCTGSGENYFGWLETQVNYLDSHPGYENTVPSSTPDTGLSASARKDYFIYCKKGEKLNETNWIIKLVTTSFALKVKPNAGDMNITESDCPSITDFSTLTCPKNKVEGKTYKQLKELYEEIKDTEKTENNTYKQYQCCGTINVSFFYPNNTFKVYCYNRQLFDNNGPNGRLNPTLSGNSSNKYNLSKWTFDSEKSQFYSETLPSLLTNLENSYELLPASKDRWDFSLNPIRGVKYEASSTNKIGPDQGGMPILG